MKRAAFLLSLLLCTPAKADTFVPWAPAPAATAKAVPVDDTDHDDVRLRLGLGYFGRFDVPLGRDGETTVGAQTIGLRLWFRRMIGFDFAIGFHTRVGSDDSSLALAARASLPIALAVTRHVTFFVAPTIGYGQGGETVGGRRQLSPITGLEWTPSETRRRGLRASVGGRIGAEVHLGFIGASRLSITGSVGVDADYSRGTTSAPPTPTSRDPEPAAVDSKSSRFAARTTFSEDAWSSVLGNIAIVGYF